MKSNNFQKLSFKVHKRCDHRWSFSSSHLDENLNFFYCIDLILRKLRLLCSSCGAFRFIGATALTSPLPFCSRCELSADDFRWLCNNWKTLHVLQKAEKNEIRTQDSRVRGASETSVPCWCLNTVFRFVTKWGNHGRNENGVPARWEKKDFGAKTFSLVTLVPRSLNRVMMKLYFTTKLSKETVECNNTQNSCRNISALLPVNQGLRNKNPWHV